MTADLAILQAAREKIADPARWDGSHAARSSAGRPCWPLDPDAARWSGYGAITWVRKSIHGLDVPPPIGLLADLVGSPTSYAAWESEPGRTHGAVLAAFARAIATLQDRLGSRGMHAARA